MKDNLISKIKKSLDKKLFKGEVHGNLIGGRGFKPMAMVYAEGMYHLYYINDCRKRGARAIYHAVSFDMLNWQSMGKMATKLAPLHHVDSGSATERNGKIELMFNYVSPFFAGARLTSSRNKEDYSELPVAPISSVALVKQKAPAHIATQGFLHPRLFRTEEGYCIVAAVKESAQNEFIMFKSPNLMDWEYKCTFMREPVVNDFRYAYPNALRFPGRQFLLYSVVKNGEAEEQTGYKECAMRTAKNCITPISYFKKMPSVHAPYVANLADGRTILLATLKDGEGNYVMAIPKEVNVMGDALRVSPVQELLYLRRKEERYFVDISAGESRVAGGNKEYLITCNSGTAMQIAFEYEGADHKTVVDLNGTAVKLIGKNSTYFTDVLPDMAVSLRIIARKGALEVYFDEGLAYLGVPTGGKKPRSVTFIGKVSQNIKVTEFNLELD